MNIGKHEYKGKTYEFKITRAARKAISESQYDIFEKLENPDVLNMTVALEQAQANLAKAEKDGDEDMIERYNEELNELSMKIIPMMKDFAKLQNADVDAEEIAIILLKNNKDYKDEMTDELAEEILDDMADKKTDEEYAEFMANLADKVFTMERLLQDKMAAVQKKNQPKEKQVVLPMS